MSPMQPLELFGVEISDEILAAGVIAIPTNFGSSIATASVTVFINRNVAVQSQGALFGIQEVQKNMLNLVTIMAVGVLGTIFDIEVVMIMTPVVVVLMILRLLKYTYKSKDHVEITSKQAWRSLVGSQRVAENGIPIADPAPLT